MYGNTAQRFARLHRIIRTEVEMSRRDPPSIEQPNVVARAQTLRLQRFVNVIMRGVLRAPLLSLAAGRRLLTIYVVGRKTGRHYAVPVAYTRLGGSLLVASQFAWMRNLCPSEPAEIRLVGKRRSAEVLVLTEEAPVVEHLRLMARDNHQFAKFNKIGFDQLGEPDPDDLRLAWVAGVRVALLTPR
jgi:hypothetical protein